jgi:hypothetical protein
MFDYKNKKTLLIAAIAAIIVIGLIWGLVIFFRGGQIQPGADQESIGGQANLPAPVFLTEAEKEAFGLPIESKVQSLVKDNSGKIMVYKIIRSDSDIVTDPSAVGSISPYRKPAAR